MIRRWNLTIILIITAFVLGMVSGYVYRDRFSWLLPDKAELERTEPDIEAAIFQSEIEDILRPDTANEAVFEPSEVFAFTGYVRVISPERIIVEEPAGAIEFRLTDTTQYVALETVINADGLPDSSETPIDFGDIQLDDIVTVYTLEDIKTATDRQVTTVQKLNNE